MAVYNAVLHSKEEVYLEAEGCYENLPLTAEEQEIVKLWEQVNLFQTAPITYLFGAESEVLDASVRSEFIALTGSEKEPIIRDAAYEYTKQDFIWSEDGALTVDEAAVTAYVDTLAAKYDTYNGIHHFNATRGEVVTIEGGTYGNQLDKKAETEYLLTAVLEQTPQTREPVYKHKALYQGSDDIGSTYIEIDMGQQMMYYYENGEIVLETPVVTGNTGRRMGTPARVCYVYNKQRNRVLRGPGYASPVKYWMPVNGNIGIHDASWRKEFGGEIYKTNGSHGCINTPTEIMAELYEKVEIGTPVVMFY